MSRKIFYCLKKIFNTKRAPYIKESSLPALPLLVSKADAQYVDFAAFSHVKQIETVSMRPSGVTICRKCNISKSAEPAWKSPLIGLNRPRLSARGIGRRKRFLLLHRYGGSLGSNDPGANESSSSFQIIIDTQDISLLYFR